MKNSTTSMTLLYRRVLRVALLLLLFGGAANALAACGDAGTPCAVDGAPASQPASGPVDMGVGNPINVVTGNKYQREVDLPALPGVLGLEIVRHYNSALSAPSFLPGPIGRGWRLSYETTLSVSGNTITITQADGSILLFGRDLADQALARHVDPAHGTIAIRTGTGKRGDDYLWTWRDGRKLSFDARGHLLQIQAPSGEILAMQYDARGLLVSVTDPQGRSLRLAWLDAKRARAGDRFRGVQSIESPVGRFDYSYGSTLPKGALPDKIAVLANLVAVRFPAVAGGARNGRRYHYEDGLHPTLLTGVSIESSSADTAGALPASLRYATYAYRGDGKAVLSSHAGNADRVTLDYGVPNQTTLTNSMGQKTVYRHTVIADQYRLLEVRGAGCSTCGETNVRYAYDQQGRLTETLKLADDGTPLRASRTAFDHLGRAIDVAEIAFVKGIAQPATRRMHYAYDSASSTQPSLIERPSVVPGKWASTRQHFNDAGQLASVTDSGWMPAIDPQQPARAISRTVRYEYRRINGRSLLVKIDGPEPNGKLGTPADSDVTLFEYDAAGNLVTRSIAPGQLVTTVIERDNALRAARISVSDGFRLSETVRVHDPVGRILQQSESAWLLDKSGGKMAASVSSNRTDYRYDGAGRLLSVVQPGRSSVHYRFDAAGNLTHTIAPDQSQTARSYDLEGRLTAEALYGPGANLGSATLYSYDGGMRASARRAMRVAPGSNVLFDEVDVAPGRPGNGDTVTEQRSSFGHALPNIAMRRGIAASAAESVVERVARPGGGEVRRWVDDFGRLVATRSPERGLETGQYRQGDAPGALTDARGSVTRIGRDAQGRALGVEYLNKAGVVTTRIAYRYQGTVLVAESRYDMGKLSSETYWHADAWGLSTGKQLLIYPEDGKSAPLGMTVRHQVDLDRGIAVQTLPSGAQLRYRFDSSGKVSAIDLGGTALVGAVRYGLARSGVKALEFTYGNGLQTRTVLDDDGMPASHATGRHRLALGRDAAHNIVSIERTPQAAPARTSAGPGGWRWPSLIASAQAQNLPPATEIRRFRYDGAQRLVGEADRDAQLLDVGYDEAGNRRGSAGAAADASGNVVTHKGNTLVYDDMGLLREVRDANGKQVVAYRYDAGGVRISKQVAGQTRYFLYEDSQLLAEMDQAGALVAEYIYLGQRPVARLRHADTTITGAVSRLFDAAHGVEYLLTDQRDAVEAVTDANGALLWEARLDGFGTLRAERGAAAYMPLRLSGQYADPETGLYYNVHRYYDAATGRYLQADPLGLAAGLNFYVYVNSDPLRKTDPLGLVDTDYDPGMPWLFGTLVHSQMALQVRALPSFGANDQRNGTWNALRPDAYRVDPANLALEGKQQPFSGTLWELKPISWSAAVNPASYRAAKAEVLVYRTKASRGCWQAGSSTSLTRRLTPTEVPMGGHMWNVNFVPDTVDDGSGLVFYTKQRAQERTAPSTVPAPVIAPAQKDELKRVVDQVKVQGQREGWSTLYTIGLIALLGVAIALLIFLTPEIAVVSALLTALRVLLLAVNAGRLTLAAGLAAMFAIPTAASAAEAEGAKKQAGLLDGTIDWFKSWF